MPKKNYSTKQREFLIDFFKGNPNKCFTVEDIFKYALSQNIAIGQTTVYRNLEKLKNEEILIKHSMPYGSGAYFQYSENAGDCTGHYHLLCTSCGGVTHLDCGYLNELSGHMQREHNFNFDKQKTVFYGHCQKCSSKSK